MLTNISLFSGAGGLDLGAKLVGGFRTVAYVEYDRYAQGVLMSRMRSGDLDDAPIFEDVRTFDGRSLAGGIDVVSGGFPCQDLSVAGKRKGINGGGRSGLWKEFARILGEVGPRCVLLENVPAITLDGNLGVVLGDLASMGFDAQWFCIPAGTFGAHFVGNRFFACGWKVNSATSSGGWERVRAAQTGAWSEQQFKGLLQSIGRVDAPSRTGKRISDGVAHSSHRLRLCGNGVVPQQATAAWKMIRNMAEKPAGEG